MAATKTIPSLNALWHKANPMPKNATIEQRINWHKEHIKHCSCRPIPPKLLAEIKARESKAHH